jgi:hypothetical protein
MKHSLKLITVFCSLITVLSACGAPAKGPSLVPASTNAVLASPSAPATGTLSPLPLPSQTFTPAPGPTATETLLPTLELPTLELTEPAFDVWDGLPTYLGDSQPNFYFRIKFNPRVWGLALDSYGQLSLSHRDIEYCILAPSGSRGLPPGMQVEHDTRQIGKLFFEINTVLINGQRQFVTYQATDKTIFTGFQVNFVNDLDACIKDAEAVLATLTSVPESQATPVTPVP